MDGWKREGTMLGSQSRGADGKPSSRVGGRSTSAAQGARFSSCSTACSAPRSVQSETQPDSRGLCFQRARVHGPCRPALDDP
jgi:hypothetical protein